MSTISVDFDGTICHGGWPDITKGRPNKAVIRWIRKRQAKGDIFVLWTCRENYGGKHFPDGRYLDDAVRFCTNHRVFFANINANAIDGSIERGWERENYGRKVRGDFYLDDRSVWFDEDSFFSPLLWRLYLWLVGRKLDRENRTRLKLIASKTRKETDDKSK